METRRKLLKAKIFGITALMVVSGVSCIFSIGSVYAQLYEQWHVNYGGGDSEWGNAVQQTGDGGYVIVGDTESFGEGEEDVYVVKTDPDGEMQWYNSFGGSGVDIGSAVQQMADGGYVIAGYTNSFGEGGNDGYLIRTDSDGEMLWSKTFGGSKYDAFNDILLTEEGDLIIAGYTGSWGAGAYDVWLLKVNPDGEMLWNMTYGGSKGDIGNALLIAEDGGFIVTGETSSSGAGWSDVLLLKTDPVGEMLWNQTFGGEVTDRGYAVAESGDGGYVIAGSTESFGAGYVDAYVVKVDSDGGLQWDEAFGGESDDKGYSVQLTAEGGYIVAGDTKSFGAGQDDIWLFEVDSDGGILWDQTLGGAVIDNGRHIQGTDDGEYVIVGRTWSFGAQGGDAWLVKLSAEEPETETETETEEETETETEEETETETEEEPEEEPEKPGGIPGFPFESVVVGLAVVTVILLGLRRDGSYPRISLSSEVGSYTSTNKKRR